jgi:hypothetical protein
MSGTSEVRVSVGTVRRVSHDGEVVGDDDNECNAVERRVGNDEGVDVLSEGRAS